MSPTGGTIAQVTSRLPDGITLSWVAQAAGPYALEVRSLETTVAGSYNVSVDGPRPAAARDREAALAAWLALAAEVHVADGRLESAKAALSEYEAAGGHWRAAEDAAGEARARRRLGEISAMLGRPTTAMPYLLAAIRLAQAGHAINEQCAAEVALAAVYLDYGRMEKSSSAAATALEIARSSHDDTCASRALNALGDVESFSGKSHEALSHYHDALTLAVGMEDRREQARALLNIAFTEFNLAQIDEALATFERALGLFRTLDDGRGEASALTGLGHLYIMGGDNQKALAHYRSAKTLVERSGDQGGLARILNGLGAAHGRSGDMESAVRYYRQGAGVFRTLHNENGEAASLLPLGLCLAALGRYQAALTSLSRALTLTRRIADRQLEARALEHIGRVRSEQRDWADALAPYEESLAISRSVGDPRGTADALNGIAAVSLKRGDTQRALQLFDEALALAVRAQDRVAQSLALYNLAKAEAALGNAEQALTRVQRSLTLADSVRTSVASLELRATYLAAVRDRHELEVQLLMRMHRYRPGGGYDARAFDASERARARALLDGLAEARAGIREGADPKLLNRKARIDRSLNAVAQQLQLLPSTGADAERASLNRRIDALSLESQDIEAQIRTENPRFAALTQPQPLTLTGVQQILEDDRSVILQYFLGRSESYVWAVTRTGVASAVLPPRHEIDNQVQAFLAALSAQRSNVQSDRNDSTRSERIRGAWLSRTILAPVARYLSYPRILVVPDGSLHLLPFAALPDPRASGSPTASAALVADHEIVYLPSASTIALLRGAWHRDQPWPKTLMVFADPVFEADDPRILTEGRSTPTTLPAGGGSRPPSLTRAMRDVGTSGISRLLAARREARGITGLVPTADVALDFDASRKQATLDLRDYRIVHFATHGFADGQHPELSGIVLSLFDRQGHPQDGFLRLRDIYNLNLPADLVVLSACSTGLGKSIAGEGMIGLVRGFMYAGSRRVLATLWKVDDEATSELMIRFYRQMFQKRLPASAALRAAQLELRSMPRWHLPVYWAAFVLEGDWTEPSQRVTAPD